MSIERSTGETRVTASLVLAPGESVVGTRLRFLDHMLVTLARYAGWTLRLQARGDLVHHTIEDVAITLGMALRDAAPEAIGRYGHRVVAMDDALVAATVDVGGRFYYEGPLPSDLYDHFLRSLCEHARVTLHVDVRRGRDRHHIVEAAFKAVGLALRDALAPTEAVVSTKGAVQVTGARGDVP